MAQAGTEPSVDGSYSIKGLLILSRLPFLLPGIAALVTGVSIGWATGLDGEFGLTAMAISGIALIMLATYYFNEYFDFEGDMINKKFIPFSGGSRAIPDGMVPKSWARLAGWSTVAILVVYAVTYLLFYFRDFPLLLPLGLFGAFCGIFYSTPPFQWAYKGIGEIIIGGCYGMLAMLSGYYVITSTLDLGILLVAVPASLTVFGIIMAAEFPDYEADKAVKKLTLVVRFKLKGSSRIFAAAMALVYPFMLASVLVGVDWRIAIVGLPLLVSSGLAVVWTLKGGYENRAGQQKIFIATLLSNLLASVLFIPVVFLW